MKRKIVALTLALGLVGLTACSNESKNVIVKTDSGNVTQDELYDAMKDKYGEQTLQQMVFEKVLNDKYKVDEKEIDEEIDALKEEYGEQFELFLMQNQLADEKDLRDTLHFNKLLTIAATEDVEISEDEVKEYYDSQKPAREVRHILLSPEDEEKAKEAKKKLDEGADFAEIAKEYSIDTVANEDGGSIGLITEDQTNIDADFRAAAFDLELNKISNPIQTSFGWHIIEVTKIEEKEKFEDVKDKLETELKEQSISNEAVQSTLQKIATEANIKVEDEDLKDTFKLFITSDDNKDDEAKVDESDKKDSDKQSDDTDKDSDKESKEKEEK